MHACTLETEDDVKAGTNGSYWIKLKPAFLDYNYRDKFVKQSEKKNGDSERWDRL